MGDDGGGMGPVGGRARADVPLKVVGVQLHQARRHDVTVAIHGPCGHVAAARDLHDLAVAKADAATDLATGQDQARIGKGPGLVHHGQIFRHGGLDAR
jgi:hypothetical protein